MPRYYVAYTLYDHITEVSNAVYRCVIKADSVSAATKKAAKQLPGVRRLSYQDLSEVDDRDIEINITELEVWLKRLGKHYEALKTATSKAGKQDDEDD